MGANPTPIALAEVYLALHTGTVDVHENPLPTIQAKKLYEVQEHVALTGHSTDALLTIVSVQTWDGLSDEDKQVFEAVSKEAADKCTQDIIKQQSELAAWFEQQGVKVARVDREPFRQAVVKLHNGPSPTWDQATYDRPQALRRRVAELADKARGADEQPLVWADEDEPVDLSDLRPEDSVVFVLFWALSCSGLWRSSSCSSSPATSSTAPSVGPRRSLATS